jgi:membrane-associated phospholipid phosphatase
MADLGGWGRRCELPPSRDLNLMSMTTWCRTDRSDPRTLPSGFATGPWTGLVAVRYGLRMRLDREPRLRRASHIWNSPEALAPPWAPLVVTAALAVTASLAAMVWHSDQLGWVDAWAMREIPAHSHGYQGFLIASAISDVLGPLLVGVMVAVGAFAWLRLRRRDALALSLLAPPATGAAKVALKYFVARQPPGGGALMYPSGHLAIATAVAVTVVLVVRVGSRSARLKRAVVTLAVLLVLVAAWARLAETAHSLSDVVGGVTTGLAVALGIALALSALSIRLRGSRLLVEMWRSDASR